MGTDEDERVEKVDRWGDLRRGKTRFQSGRGSPHFLTDYDRILRY